MTPSVRNGIRPAHEKGPTEAGSGAMLAMHPAGHREESGGVTTRGSLQVECVAEGNER